MNFTGGLPETVCGGGSTLASTAELRTALPALLRDLKCETLIDAPCGDLNWMPYVDLQGIDYVGVDIPERLADVREKAGQMDAASVTLVMADIVTQPLPAGDVVLCRDFLQHLPTGMVAEVLQNILSSGMRWLLVTSHPVQTNEILPHLGGFRPLNFRLPPFSFVPSATIPDCGRELLLISREALAARTTGAAA